MLLVRIFLKITHSRISAWITWKATRNLDLHQVLHRKRCDSVAAASSLSDVPYGIDESKEFVSTHKLAYGANMLVLLIPAITNPHFSFPLTSVQAST